MHDCAVRFLAAFEERVAGVLARELRGAQPQPVVDLREQLTLLLRQLETKQSPVRVHDAYAGLVKRVVLEERRAAAEALEEPLAKVTDPTVAKGLSRALAPYDELMTAAWFDATDAVRVPRLGDFLSIRYAEEAAPLPPLLPRAWDEKFRILEAPALALPDLAHYRARCRARGASLAVGFADIDDFKSVNTRLGETTVDLKVLAPFMEVVEAWAFARAHAYRFGGDEYVLLLPNVDEALAVALVRELGRRVAAADYRGTKVALSLSVGLAILDPECHLTDREALARANAAKAVAKGDKGSVAVCRGPRWGEAAIERA